MVVPAHVGGVPWEIFLMYVSIAISALLLFLVFSKKIRFRVFIIYQLIVTFILNIHYFIDGPASRIAFFIAIYDPLHNLGREGDVPALQKCVEGDDCSAWSDSFDYHASWGVSFYRRFSEDNPTRHMLLYLHIGFQTLAFVVMNMQFINPGPGPKQSVLVHKILGYISLLALVVGVGSSWLMASEHGEIENYGGNAAKYGFYFLGMTSMFPAVMGFISAKQRNFQAHAVWMYRLVGAMWGAYWVFRVMEFVNGGLLRSFNSLSILMSVWLSGPIGIFLGDLYRKKTFTKTKPN